MFLVEDQEQFHFFVTLFVTCQRAEDILAFFSWAVMGDRIYVSTDLYNVDQHVCFQGVFNTIFAT